MIELMMQRETRQKIESCIIFAFSEALRKLTNNVLNCGSNITHKFSRYIYSCTRYWIFLHTIFFVKLSRCRFGSYGGQANQHSGI